MHQEWAAAGTTYDGSGPLEWEAIFKIVLPQKLVMAGTTKSRNTKAQSARAIHEVIDVDAHFHT